MKKSMAETDKDVDVDKIPVGEWELKSSPPTIKMIEPKWSRRLWPLFSWLVFLFNFMAVASFLCDLWVGEYDSVKHVLIAITMCGSYAALKYIHEKISGQNDDGRFS